MKNINEVSVITTSMLPELKQELELVFIDDHYEIKNYDHLISKIDQWLESVDNYVYVPEDRKNVKSLKAENNKLLDHVKSIISTQSNQLLGVVNAQKTQLTTKLSSLTTKLSKGIDEEDKKFKQQRKLELQEFFEENKVDFDSIKHSTLEFDDIFLAQWVNRSSSIKKVKSEIIDRLKSIEILIDSPTSPTSNIDEIVDALDFNNWSGLQALDYLIKRETARQEKELQRQLEERLKLEKQLEKTQSNDLQDFATISKIPDVLIKISGEDAEKAKKLLSAAGIDFSVI